MNNKGFTLVEVLIGLFIAVVASAYAAKTITSTNKVIAAGRDVFIATNLAHEGLDLTRALRDNTWFADPTPLDRSEWLSESGICEDLGTHRYTVDPNVVRDFLASKAKVPNDSKQELYIQGNTLWTHATSSKQTAYKRVLTAECAHVDEEPAFVTITSTVTWKGQNGQDKSTSIKELLYNWL